MSLLPVFMTLFNLIFGYDEAEILFAGDAMQHQAQLDAARTGRNAYDYSGCFSEIAPMIKSADYAVVNLETPLGNTNHTGYPCFNAPADYAYALKEAGFNMMLTANNHTLDRRDNGVRSTIAYLDKAEIDHLGTYRNQAARDSIHPYIRRISGIDVGFLNYTYGTNGITVSSDVVVDYIEKDLIRRDVERLKKAGAEILAVTIHWGDEYNMVNNKSQRNLADFLMDLGVDMIIGSHPHVIQPMEIRYNEVSGKNTLIVYSLGNFISNMKTRDTRGGAVVRARLVRGEDGVARLESASYRLVFTVPADGKNNFMLVDAEDYDGAYCGACKEFVKSAENIFSRYNIGVGKSQMFIE